MRLMDPQIFLNVANEIEFIEKFYSEKIFSLIDGEFAAFDKKVDARRLLILEYLISQNEDNSNEIARREALEWGMQNVDPLLLIESLVIDAALLSMFSFFEVKMKSFFAKYYYQAPFIDVDEQGRRLEREDFFMKVENFNFEQLLKNFVAMFGLKLSDEIEEKLKEFNLLVNSIKHGDGASFAKIRKQFPNRIEDGFDILPKSQFLIRSRDDLRKFSFVLKRLLMSFDGGQLNK